MWNVRLRPSLMSKGIAKNAREEKVIARAQTDDTIPGASTKEMAKLYRQHILQGARTGSV